MTNYTILSKFRNKENVNYLVNELIKRKKTCYNFCDGLNDPFSRENNDTEERMKNFESVEDFYNNKHFKEIFQKDLNGLKNSENVVVLLPAGNAVHIEMGIAFGLNKKLILIGEVEKPETLYLIFNERYRNMKDFLESVK